MNSRVFASAFEIGDLPSRIAVQIIEHVRELDLSVGAHLPAQSLATKFRVSRTPVNQALELLETLDFVEARPNKGFFLRKSPSDLELINLPEVVDEEDPLYFQIAEDRLAGHLPPKVTEAELMRRYNVHRARLVRLLTGMTKEGWLVRLPGHGWEFQPILASAKAYDQSYRYRSLIEPAALREPGYEIDQRAFSQVRMQQQALLDGGIFRFSPTEIFQFMANFHETIVRCSGNVFLTEGMLRVNRLRRLIEYRTKRDRHRLVNECKEHLELLDMIESGNSEQAAEFLERHLDRARTAKLPLSGVTD